MERYYLFPGEREDYEKFVIALYEDREKAMKNKCTSLSDEMVVYHMICDMMEFFEIDMVMRTFKKIKKEMKEVDNESKRSPPFF
ncbi:hypothetical protein Mpt1_c10020 [Candidatus Methanoplasma termitum]|uniref:Uncharacterized protein n=1 Tax=Candidatus Methanoplasma termitum TaxID=1577791 RepID=A0A0A7LCG7_9ARCH|nr:hypothetical protein [Candidatus Methanoplasma termitum]AIZ56875.1 hypothetical protein Mpt1_c10020 [Candidatus Methanoplasma termitum]MCL2333509.1 hypothetical protein [Candidatus Methanoplasma sp.]